MPKPKSSSMPTDEEIAEAIAMGEIEKRASAELEPLVESPALNKLLIRHARRSPREIEAITGIPAAEVAERLDALLDSGSIRDDLMEEKLTLLQISELVNDIQSRMSRTNVEDEGWASMARVALAGMKTSLEQIDKRRKNLDGKLATITMEQAQMFAETIRMAHEIMMRALETKYPDLDAEIIHAEFDAALPIAITQLENRAHA